MAVSVTIGRKNHAANVGTPLNSLNLLLKKSYRTNHAVFVKFAGNHHVGMLLQLQQIADGLDRHQKADRRVAIGFERMLKPAGDEDFFSVQRARRDGFHMASRRPKCLFARAPHGLIHLIFERDAVFFCGGRGFGDHFKPENIGLFRCQIHQRGRWIEQIRKLIP